MKYRALSLCVVVCVCVLAVLGAPSRDWDGASREAMFVWFDGLGYPDLKGKPFARAWRGYSQRNGEMKRPMYRFGWVLREEGSGRFDLLGMDLTQEESPPWPKGEAQWWWPRCEKEDFEACAREWLGSQVGQDKASGGNSRVGSSLGSRLSLPGVGFIFARVAALNGNEALSKELYTYAAGMKLPEKVGRLVIKPDGSHTYEMVKGPDFKQTLIDDLAKNRMWQMVELFEKTDVTREELLSMSEAFVKNFPASAQTQAGLEMRNELAQMVAEEKARASVVSKDMSKMSADEKARELVFQLRDMPMEDWYRPVNSKGELTASGQLRAMGFDAMPALIEALEDTRFTRMVRSHKDYYFSHHVLRVGDAAELIIAEIAGQRFYQAKHTNGAMVRDGQAKVTRERVEAWWGQVKAKGEKQILIEGVERGDGDACDMAERLVKKYGGEALAPIKKGFAQAKESWVRGGLASRAGGIKTPEAKAWLREVLLEDKELDTRLGAARGLMKMDPSGTLAAIAEQWKKLAQGDEKGQKEVMYFLGRAESAGAVEMLAEGVGRLGPALRSEAIQCVEVRGGDREGLLVVGAFEKAVEEYWISRLDDTQVVAEASDIWGYPIDGDTRVGDVAAIMLTRTWRGKYRFNHAGSPWARDYDRGAMMNTWLKEQGKATRLLPRAPESESLSAEEMAPLIKQVMSAETDSQREGALKEVAARGLPALRQVKAALAGLGKDDTARPGLERVGRELSWIVVDVAAGKESVWLDAELKALLAELKGKPLTAERYVSVLTYLVRNAKGTSNHIRLEVSRDGAGSGVVIRVKVGGAGAGPGGRFEGWHVEERVECGGIMWSQRISTGLDERKSATGYGDLMKAMEEGQRQPEDAPFKVVCEMLQSYRVIW